MKSNITTAKKFYSNIKHENEKFKLINGLFIVKFFNENLCYYIGELLKANSPQNTRKSNLIRLSNVNPQIFDIKRLETFNGLAWKRLDISFNQKPIEEILKC